MLANSMKIWKGNGNTITFFSLIELGMIALSGSVLDVVTSCIKSGEEK
jgi:hypothetical protein